MNLFMQSFKLLHKNMKIALVFLAMGVMGDIVLMVAEKNIVITGIFLLVYAVVNIAVTILAVGWSNEAVLHGKILEKPAYYLRYFWKVLGVMGIQTVVLIMVNLGFMYKIFKGIPEHMNWNDLQVVGDWVIQNSQIILLTLFVNLIVAILFTFAPYIAVIEGKGILHAIKLSFIYSFKGIIVGFLSGLAIICILVALLLVLDFIFKPGTLSSQVVRTLLAAYGQAIYTVFTVGLYHKLNKSA